MKPSLSSCENALLHWNPNLKSSDFVETRYLNDIWDTKACVLNKFVSIDTIMFARLWGKKLYWLRWNYVNCDERTDSPLQTCFYQDQFMEIMKKEIKMRSDHKLLITSNLFLLQDWALHFLKRKITVRNISKNLLILALWY